ncbi:MAG TPA: flagellar biosynthetic protein FliR [Burkholderiaceae bacterium]|nr:flagellar biosynthetic protein FliR [Burkholderiaceae bacterium]
MLTFSEAQIGALYGAVFWPLARVLALFATAPIFSHPSLGVRVRVALALAISLLLAPQVATPPIDRLAGTAGLLALAQDMMVGLVLGFTVRLVFAAIEFAGEMMGLQIGLSFAGFFNPTSSQSQTPISTFLSLVATLMFLSIDGHLQLLQALAETFRAFPIGADGIPLSAEQVARMGSRMFSLGLSIALPFIAVALLTSILLGILSRVAPQLNLFGIGFPLTLTSGLTVLALLMPYLEKPLRTALEGAVGFWLR